jgi:hypothetical protein
VKFVNFSPLKRLKLVGSWCQNFLHHSSWYWSPGLPCSVLISNSHRCNERHQNPVSQRPTLPLGNRCSCREPYKYLLFGFRQRTTFLKRASVFEGFPKQNL